MSVRPQIRPEYVLPGRLRTMAPFDTLGAEQLIVAAGRAELVRFPDGATVLERGADDPHDYFLLEGTLTLTNVAGETTIVTPGEGPGASAIAAMRPSLYDVHARGRAVCARLPRVEVALLRSLQSTEADMSIEEMTANLSETRGLLLDLEADIETDRVRLPSIPDVALRIRDILGTGRCDNRRIAELLSADPAAAAKILKIANSPLCRGIATIDNLHDAVGRIGMHTVSELIICFSLKDLFDSGSPTIRARFAELVGESVRVGAAASVVAERAGRDDGERALVAGLLGNVGALPILQALGMRPEVVENPVLADQAIERHAARIGEVLCRRWALGEPIVEAVREAHNWAWDPGGEPTLADCVLCARYHVMIGLGRTAELPPAGSIAALGVFGRTLTAEDGLAIIKDSKTRVDSLLDIV